MLESCTMGGDEIEQKCSSGVVLVQNASYYELDIGSGSIYFASYDPEKGLDGIEGLQVEEDSIEYQLSYGTGFFISEDGLIATNKHVVSSHVTEEEAQQMYRQIINALKETIREEYEELSNLQSIVRNQMSIAYYNDDYSKLEELNEFDDEIIAQKDEYREYYQNLCETDYRDSKLHYYNNISIAYNDTYVTGQSDFIGCVVKKVSDDADLAIIQLKDKKTPSDKYVFELSSENPLTAYSLGEKLSKILDDDKNEKVLMMGYNLGPVLALTEEGIKSQINEGSISQNTSDRIMYSIPALQGSSGAPVVNGRGQLVAINFAGLNSTQGFNYGIKEDLLYELLNE